MRGDWHTNDDADRENRCAGIGGLSFDCPQLDDSCAGLPLCELKPQGDARGVGAIGLQLMGGVTFKVICMGM